MWGSSHLPDKSSLLRDYLNIPLDISLGSATLPGSSRDDLTERQGYNHGPAAAAFVHAPFLHAGEQGTAGSDLTYFVPRFLWRWPIVRPEACRNGLRQGYKEQPLLLPLPSEVPAAKAGQDGLPRSSAFDYPGQEQVRSWDLVALDATGWIDL
jgi:hypothetical protein